MTNRSTSFRLSEEAKQRLAQRAAAEGVSVTALVERLIIEGIDALDHPGIVHRGPANDRRAALVAGPDVWEVVARLRELPGAEEARITTLADETGLHPRQIRMALEYAANHPQVVEQRIQRNEAALDAARRAAAQRRALLG